MSTRSCSWTIGAMVVMSDRSQRPGCFLTATIPVAIILGLISLLA